MRPAAKWRHLQFIFYQTYSQLEVAIYSVKNHISLNITICSPESSSFPFLIGEHRLLTPGGMETYLLSRKHRTYELVGHWLQSLHCFQAQLFGRHHYDDCLVSSAFNSHLLSLGMGHVDINGYGRHILYCGVHVEQNRSEFAGKK